MYIEGTIKVSVQSPNLFCTSTCLACSFARMGFIYGSRSRSFPKTFEWIPKIEPGIKIKPNKSIINGSISFKCKLHWRHEYKGTISFHCKERGNNSWKNRVWKINHSFIDFTSYDVTDGKYHWQSGVSLLNLNDLKQYWIVPQDAFLIL
jgi:hypothetical protein